MQLKRIITGFFVFVTLGITYAQNEKKTSYEIGDVEVDFLFSYYEQQGDHSAVQGGVGDQHLNDFVSGIIVNVPFDTSYVFNLKFSADAYTSASTNRIDDPTNPMSSFYETDFVSSASYTDNRVYSNLNLTKIFSKQNSMVLGLGFSHEFDVLSFSYNLGWNVNTKNNNTSLQLLTSGIFDTWDLIYPVELRTLTKSNPSLFLSTNKRQSYNGAMVLSQVLTPKIQTSLSYDFTIQQGLLSTPFHRVYFDDGSPLDDPSKAVDIERLPDQRIKHAVGLRVNAFPISSFIVRSFFRYYSDSYGIEAFTGEFEVPIKFTRFISVYPLYRYSTQTESKFFKPFGVHVWDIDAARGVEEFYTSDYDLSSFYSQKLGLGVRISPAFGIAKSKEIPYVKRSLMFKSIEMRGGLYKRSDGLSAFFAALSFSLVF